MAKKLPAKKLPSKRPVQVKAETARIFLEIVFLLVFVLCLAVFVFVATGYWYR